MKICFVALQAYSFISNKNFDQGGGPEVLQTILGRKLNEVGFEVSFIVYCDDTHFETINGIKLFKIRYSKNKIINMINIFKMMFKVKADIYYHHSGATPIVALFAKLLYKKYCLHIASNGCVLKGINGYKTWFIDILLADKIILQTLQQKILLKRNYNREGIVLSNYFPNSTTSFIKKDDPPIVIWIGSMSQIKQPLLALDIVKKLKDVQFLMVGGMGDSKDLFKIINEKAKELPNLHLLGHISFERTNIVFQKASILLNTSKLEGFPVAYIQAWQNYIPVISINSDPDEIICKKKLGFHSTSIEECVLNIGKLVKNKELRKEMGINCRKYYLTTHASKQLFMKYVNLLINIYKE